MLFHGDDRRRGRAAAELLGADPAGFTVATFREKAGVSRKYALPLLAELDARGITRRRDDLRIAGPRCPVSGTSLRCCTRRMTGCLDQSSRSERCSTRIATVRLTRLGASTLTGVLAVVLGCAVERFDLERDTVDGGDSQRLAGLDRRRPVRPRPPLRLADLDHAIGVDGLTATPSEPISSTRARSSAWRSAFASSTACRR